MATIRARGTAGTSHIPGAAHSARTRDAIIANMSITPIPRTPKSHPAPAIFPQIPSRTKLTSSVPMVREVIACLAGLARMSLLTFVLATAIGAVPTGLAYAAIGVGWSDRPLLAVVVAYLLPIALLPFLLRLMSKR